nr:hypothetical protein HAGR004_41020 [Bdellovibrio sp. HAGR004]
MNILIVSLLGLAHFSAFAADTDLNPPSIIPTPKAVANAFLIQGKKLTFSLPQFVKSATDQQKKQLACQNISTLARLTQTMTQHENAVTTAAYSIDPWTTHNLAAANDLVKKLEESFCINKTMTMANAMRLAEDIRNYQIME